MILRVRTPDGGNHDVRLGPAPARLQGGGFYHITVATVPNMIPTLTAGGQPMTVAERARADRRRVSRRVAHTPGECVIPPLTQVMTVPDNGAVKATTYRGPTR